MTQLPPTLVATFDGGGTRGLVCLYIFQAMMEIVKQIHQRQVAVERGWSGEILPDVTYDPHQWFDLMIGTSTGGLISIMLARLRLDIPTCIQQYRILSVRIFGNPASKFWQTMKSGGTCRFSAEKLAEAVEDVVRMALSDVALQGRKTLLHDDDSTSSVAEPCRTAVVASYLQKLGTGHKIFRSDDSGGITIREAARATSAAPTYFEGIEIGGTFYGDGGMGANNPAELTMQHVARRSGAPKFEGYLFSFGTGSHSSDASIEAKSTVRGTIPYLKGLVGLSTAMMTDCEETHQRLALDNYTEDLSSQRYFRFNVADHRVGALGLDACSPKALSLMQSCAEAESRKYPMVKDLERAARRIVDIKQPLRLRFGACLFPRHRAHNNAAGGLSYIYREVVDPGTKYPTSVVIPDGAESISPVAPIGSEILTCRSISWLAETVTISGVPAGIYRPWWTVWLFGMEAAEQEDSVSERYWFPKFTTRDIEEAARRVAANNLENQNETDMRQVSAEGLRLAVGIPAVVPVADPMFPGHEHPISNRIGERTELVISGFLVEQNRNGWTRMDGTNGVQERLLKVGKEGKMVISISYPFGTPKQRRWRGGWSFGGLELERVDP